MPDTPVYHRLESPTQSLDDLKQQLASGLLCGRPHRGSDMPSVKAYTGPLKPGQRGIEFTTVVAPTPGTPPYLALWRRGSPGVVESGDPDMVCIPVEIIRVTQG